MYDESTKRGVLNDFNLARWNRQDGKPSGKENTGTMPFMALDLLNPEASRGMVQRRYRHDAESFAWCLVYICVCMKKAENGKILVISPHPLLSWFRNPDASSRSKTEEETVRLLKEVPLHKSSKDLAAALRHHWVTRFKNHSQATSLASVGPPAISEDLPAHLKTMSGRAITTVEAYKEPSELKSFQQVYQLLLDWSGMVPRSKQNISVGMLILVAEMYEFHDGL